ncbi:MAG: hypothetical protein ACRD3W_04720, partial [Terriglobales bacterium]
SSRDMNRIAATMAKRLEHNQQAFQQQIQQMLAAYNQKNSAKIAQLAQQLGGMDKVAARQARTNALLERLYARYLQDQYERQIEQALLANGLYRGLQPLGPYGGNLMNLIGQLAGAAAALADAAQQQQGEQAENQAADQIQDLLSQLPDDVAARVVNALQAPSPIPDDDQATQDASRQAELDTPVRSTIANSGLQNMDDYERLSKLADELGASNANIGKQYLELAIDAAGRCATNLNLADDDRKKAKNFAYGLTAKVGMLRTKYGAGQTDEIKKALDFDLQKCVRISSGQDIYAA